jgi:hypothetical protein
MKIGLSSIAFVLLFASCQKDLSDKEESKSLSVASDALLPLPCHSTSFVSDHPIEPGKQPPFKFTKTLYSDTRVKTINMLSRAVPNHPAYKKQMWETIGQFAYATNKATFTGTKQLWEYYKTSTGAGARKSISKKNISLTFHFNSNGYVFNVHNNYAQSLPSDALLIEYNPSNPHSIADIEITSASAEGPKLYDPQSDQFGNMRYLFTTGYPYNPGLVFTYDYTAPRGSKNYSFIPTQNWISFEYNLCEVMQWLPQPMHQRKTVNVEFWINPTTEIIQGQQYKNYKFDSKGNQTSLTYGDNILQKTTWYCK